MIGHDMNSDNLEQERQLALAKLKLESPADDDLTRDDALALVHELRAQQVDLQVQVNALRSDQAGLSSPQIHNSRRQNDFSLAVIEQSPIPMAVANLNGDMCFNSAFAEHLQIPSDAVDRENLNIFDLKSPWQYFKADGHSLSQNEFSLVRALRGESTKDLEIQLVGQDGGESWKLINSGPIYNETGELVAGFLSLSDITQLKNVEQKLRDAERESRVWLESSPVCTKKVDLDFNLRYMSSAGVNALLIEDITELYGKPYPLDFFPEKFKAGMLEKLNYVKSYEKLTTHEMAIDDANGNAIYFHSTLAPVFDDDGCLDYILVVSINTTDRIRALEQLKQQTKLATEMARQAKAANDSKSDFLANMSHEIRTPMTAILGFTETIADSVEKPEDIRAIETVRRNGEYLLAIINDILDHSKIESGKLEIENIAHSPCLVIAEVAALMESRAHAKGLNFNVEFIGEIPETIETDPLRLQQILINLVGNAIKFTEVGAVELSVRLLREDGGTFIQFDVVDTGIGMSQMQTKRLFKPFTQADSSTTRNYGGTGLGLTISKRFAEMLGGDIVISDSELGSGTRFRITVATGSLEGVKMISDPGAVIFEANQRFADADFADLTGMRILLAEDGLDNQKLISYILSKAGAEVEIAENGKIAVESALRANANGTAFDCIVMDMQMPVMCGNEATAALRNANYTGRIIALTAHAMIGDREKCLSAGCDDFTIKPIKRAELLSLIAADPDSISRAA